MSGLLFISIAFAIFCLSLIVVGFLVIAIRAWKSDKPLYPHSLLEVPPPPPPPSPPEPKL